MREISCASPKKILTIMLTSDDVRRAFKTVSEWDTKDRKGVYGQGVLKDASGVGACGEISVGKFLGVVPALEYCEGGAATDLAYRGYSLEVKTRDARAWPPKRQPDLWWIKSTDRGGKHILKDSVVFRSPYIVCCALRRDAIAYWVDIHGWCRVADIPREMHTTRYGKWLNYHITTNLLEDPRLLPEIGWAKQVKFFS